MSGPAHSVAAEKSIFDVATAATACPIVPFRPEPPLAAIVAAHGLSCLDGTASRFSFQRANGERMIIAYYIVIATDETKAERLLYKYLDTS
ncbi:hypothetical protein HGP14_18270 [Rhizobium sp. P32RR-XVIII]|uniref:hypothetical protein n=1 Tax=Rhizobium sp. P32RR-XVIII TaxID=2726738 RepID=UPI0014578F51|nr:hypothetical protein [Rhizobium sp. P32RR-XVIII]NLS05294.1 hypothetical protein [Rhizobium sp. P32RR-XVIII]